MQDTQEFMTSSQVARRLRLSVERVRQLSRTGRLPADAETPLGKLWSAATVDRFEATRDHFGRFTDRAARDGGAEQ
jgi:hypothetical protein